MVEAFGAKPKRNLQAKMSFLILVKTGAYQGPPPRRRRLWRRQATVPASGLTPPPPTCQRA